MRLQSVHLTPIEPSERVQAVAQQGISSKPNILIVDDEDSIRSLLEAVLQTKYNVFKAKDSNEARLI